MCFQKFQKIKKVIDDTFSLRSAYTTFNEDEFSEYKKDHSQRLLDNFFEIAMAGITAAFIFRVVILSSQNAILDLILPFIIFMFIALAYYINKSTTQMKHYFHMIVIPIVGLLTARKTISQNTSQFFLNESFASWLIMMMFGGFSSTQQWYMVVAINLACFFVYISIIFRFYGISAVGNDFYVHITTTIIFSTTLIRMNEVNLRNSFNLLSTSKIQERKWQRVLTMLTDGVLIMQHTENDKGILLINPSLQKILGNKQMDTSGDDKFEHTCELKNRIIDNGATPQGKSEISQINSTERTSSQLKIAETQNPNLQQNCQDNFDDVVSSKKNQYFTLNDNMIQQPEQIKNQIEENNTPVFHQTYCKGCLQENQKSDSKKLLKKDNTLGKRRFNEKRVGPIFDEIFRDIRFKIIFQSSQQNGDTVRHSTDPQFLNDFICKQMEYFKTNLPSGYSERLFLKVLNPRAVIELHMIKLDDDSQVLFLFKEVSVYNKLSKAKTTEKISNILINSIAHNLFTPLNVLIQLNKQMSDLISSQNDIAQKNVQMIGVCLQQLVFTTHNILEMSKIRQGRFKQSSKEVCVVDKLEQIFDYFKDDIKFREIDFQVKQQDKLKQFKIILDDARFVILLYNIVSNSVKHTNGGHIKVSMKLLTEAQAEIKKEKYAKIKQELQMKLQNEWASNQTQDNLEQSSDESQRQDVAYASTTERRGYEISDTESGDKSEKFGEKNIQDESLEKVYLSVSVSDTGVGMNDEMRRKCFTLFGNLKFKKDVNQGGIGLGLASSSLICKALQGHLDLVRSQINEGSKFNFIIQVVLGKEIGDTSEDSQSDSTNSKYYAEQENNQDYLSSGEVLKREINLQENDYEENDYEEGEASQTETIDSELIEKIQQENSMEQGPNQIQIEQGSQKNQCEFEGSEEDSEYSEEGETEQNEIEETIVQESSDKIENMTSTSQIIKETMSQLDINDGYKKEFFKLKKLAIIKTMDIKEFSQSQSNIGDTFQKMKIQDESNILLQQNQQKIGLSIQKQNTKFSEGLEDSFVNFLNESSTTNQINMKFGNLMLKKGLNSIPQTQMLSLDNKNFNKNEQQEVFFIPSFNKHQKKINLEKPIITTKQSLLKSYNQQRKELNQNIKILRKNSEKKRHQIIAGSQIELQMSNSIQKDLQDFQQQIQHSSSKNIKLNLEQNSDKSQQVDQTDQDIKELSNEFNQFQGNNDDQFRMSGENDLSEIQNLLDLVDSSTNQIKNLNISKSSLKKKEIFTQDQLKRQFPSQKLYYKGLIKKQSIGSGQKQSEDSKSKHSQSSKSINRTKSMKVQVLKRPPQQMKMISKAIISEYEKESTMSLDLRNPPKIIVQSFIDDCDQDSEQDDFQERKKISQDPKIKGLMSQQQYIEFMLKSKDSSLKESDKKSEIQSYNTPSSSYMPKKQSKYYNDIGTNDSIKKSEEIEQAQIITENKKIRINLEGSVNTQIDFQLEELDNQNNQQKDSNSSNKFKKLLIHSSINSQRLHIKPQKKSLSQFSKNEKRSDCKSSQFYKENQNSLDRKGSDCSSEDSKMKIKRKQSMIKHQDNRIESKSHMQQREKSPSDNFCYMSNQKKVTHSAKAQIRDHSNVTGGTPSSGRDSKKKSPISDRLDHEDLPPVLIVDDTVFNIQILQMIFKQKYKINSDQAVSGEEALMKCKQRVQRNQESYKLIVMDINMPGMDGVVTTNKIRQFTDAYVKKRQQRGYMIVAHTAIPEDQFGNFHEKGFDAFMQKPLDHEQLEKYLKKVHLN